MRTWSLVFWLLSAATVAALGAPVDVHWSDGTVAPAPAGQLLSDNFGFYGDIRLTGVTYQYCSAVEPGSGDSAEDTEPQRGRRLLNGDLGDASFPWTDPKPPRLVSPASVEFDFRTPCTFREVDLRLPVGRYRVALQEGVAPEQFETCLPERPHEVTNERSLLRLRPAAAVGARYLGLTITSESGQPVALSEVYVWGESAAGEDAYRRAGAVAVADTGEPQGVPGIAGTMVEAGAFTRWAGELANASGGALPPAVWSDVPAWRPLSEAPVLPAPAQVGAPVDLVMVRNETEPAALVLTNTSLVAPYAAEVKLSGFETAQGEAAAGITGEVMALGALPTRDYGVQLSVLISAANKPGTDVLRRFCTNGLVIGDFPRINLNRAGNLLTWVKITTRGCAPGLYTARLSAGEGAAKQVRVRVVDALLQDAPRFVNYWSKPFAQYPFEPAGWVARDAAHRLEIGITVLSGVPGDDPGSLANLMRKAQPNMLFGLWQGQYGGRLWAAGHMEDPWGKDDLTAEDIAGIQADARGIANYARANGLSFDQWYFEMADEPNSKNLRLFGAVATAMHEAVPEAMISCNPCCWKPEAPHFEPDDLIYPLMANWYDAAIAISLPAVSLLDYPLSGALFRAPRRYNAHYEVVTQRAKSESAENVSYPRMLVWKTIAEGFNGWNLFCYHNPAAGEVWDDMHLRNAAFALVYPGPNGPVPTRQFEAAREGYEDYMLMDLLRKRDLRRHAEVLEASRAGAGYAGLRGMIYDALEATGQREP